MDKKKVLPFFTDWLLCLVLSAGSFGCMVTGFQLNVEAEPLILALAFWPLAAAVFARLRFGWIPAGLILVYMGHQGLLKSLKNLFLLIGRVYYQGYSWDIDGMFADAGPEILDAPVTEAMVFLLALSALVTAWVLAKRKSGLWCLPPVLLPLVTTLVVIDTVPEPVWIALLLLGLALLLLTHSARRQDGYQGARLTLLTALPVCLCVYTLMVCIPRDSYQPPDFRDGILQFLLNRADDIPGVDIGDGGGLMINQAGSSGRRVNLNTAGPKTYSRRQALVLRTNVDGALYLRGRSYSEYTGLRWTSQNSPEQELFEVNDNYLQYSFMLMGGMSSVELDTGLTRPLRFVPYYPQEAVELENGTPANPEHQAEYTFLINPLQENWQQRWEANHRGYAGLTVGTYPAGEQEVYLQLPESTLVWAREVVAQLGVRQDQYAHQVANIIAEYVSGHAEYDLQTRQMPATQEDFARWFLESAETGYCIHFATAATVLLRAAGVPARYVEGYAIRLQKPEGQLFQTVTVEEGMAHAWVEYYMPDVGWVMLEATPAAGIVTQGQTPGGSSGTTAPSTTQPSTGTSTRPGTAPGTRPSATAAPSSTAQAPAPKPQAPTALIVSVSAAAGAVLLGILQWQLRLYLRRRYMTRGNRNAQALRRWRFAQFLAKLRKQQVPEELRALAQKAKFSKTGVRSAELALFDAWFAESVAALKGKPWYWQILYRPILALY